MDSQARGLTPLLARLGFTKGQRGSPKYDDGSASAGMAEALPAPGEDTFAGSRWSPKAAAAGSAPLEMLSKLVHERAHEDEMEHMEVEDKKGEECRHAACSDVEEDALMVVAPAAAPSVEATASPVGSSPHRDRVAEAYVAVPSSTPVLSLPRRGKVVIAVDNDECIGSWGTCRGLLALARALLCMCCYGAAPSRAAKGSAAAARG
jgi:hypothetical protein